MIKINNISIPTPSEFRITIKENAVSERNASGSTIMDFSGSKRVLKLKWSNLNGEALSTLLQAVEGDFFTAEFPDPMTGTVGSANFRCSIRSAGIFQMQNEHPFWTDIEMEWSEQ